GLDPGEVTMVLQWYDAIVGAVTAITAGHPVRADGRRAFAELRARLLDVAHRGRDGSLLALVATLEELTPDELVSNAGVLLFGGVETTEGMISNALLALLDRPELLAVVRGEPELISSAVEESMRLEPAAAVVDRYATAATSLRGVSIAAGELVRVSIAAANRDPAIFDDPDNFDLYRRNARRHLAFARGPHVCLGIHLARLEAQTAIGQLLVRLSRLRLDPARRAPVRGIVFRKPLSLHALWS
ncbi:MAG: cytochrome P450, partial [Solirubrobacterales bacterium]|nr:cytochrome P450 [Solirubrobacterales bacterium]